MGRDFLYRSLEGIHNLYFNNMRFGQFISTLCKYFNNNTSYDLEYIKDEKFIDMVQKFAERNSDEVR